MEIAIYIINVINDSGDVILEDYIDVKGYANNGKRLCSIKLIAGFEAMPTAALKLSECQIIQIENWSTLGVQHN